MDFKRRKQKTLTITLWQLQELLFEKIDVHAYAFINRIEAMKIGKIDEAEYIEQMVLDPINIQIRYLARKIIKLLSDEKYGQH